MMHITFGDAGHNTARSKCVAGIFRVFDGTICLVHLSYGCDVGLVVGLAALTIRILQEIIEMEDTGYLRFLNERSLK